MTNSERLFLLLAEELNFGRAAKKAFLSQQCLSDHMKRLEEHYGTALFTRRPAVALTDAGKAVRRTLLAMRNLEHGLEEELAEIENGAYGTLRIGLNYTRARILIPSLFARCRRDYPHVRLELVLEETRTMQELLTQGKLDCFLGVNAQCAPPLARTPLAEEGLYCMASSAYLRRYGLTNPDALNNLITPADLRNFQGLPFIMNNRASTTYQQAERCMAACNVSVDTVLSVSDYDILERICRGGEVASFCPRFFTPAILARNASFSPEERLYLLPISGLENALRFDLVYNGTIRYPRYARDCFRYVQEIVENYLSSDKNMATESSNA